MQNFPPVSPLRAAAFYQLALIITSIFIFSTIMKKRGVHIAVLLVLLAVNLYIFYNRDNGYRYQAYKTYPELYVTDSSLYLQNMVFTTDSLKLQFSLPLSIKGYKVNNGAVLYPKHTNITIPVKAGINRYDIIPLDAAALPIHIIADHSAIAGSTPQAYDNEFIYCNLPGPQIKVSPLTIWMKGSERFSKDELQYAVSLLKANTRVFEASTDSARLMEIARYVQKLPCNTQAPTWAGTSPMLQIKLAQQHKVNLLCGNYCVIFFYLCSAIHMPNRGVTYLGHGESWHYGAHYLNEIYLREKQQWVIADGMSNIYMPHDSIRYYNLADVKKMAATNGFGYKYAHRFVNDTLQECLYDTINYWHNYYNLSNARIGYIIPGKDIEVGHIKSMYEFYSFATNFYFYSDTESNNWLLIFIKMAAFTGFIIAFIFCIVTGLQASRKKRKTYVTSKKLL